MVGWWSTKICLSELNNIITCFKFYLLNHLFLTWYKPSFVFPSMFHRPNTCFKLARCNIPGTVPCGWRLSMIDDLFCHKDALAGSETGSLCWQTQFNFVSRTTFPKGLVPKSTPWLALNGGEQRGQYVKLMVLSICWPKICGHGRLFGEKNVFISLWVLWCLSSNIS